MTAHQIILCLIHQLCWSLKSDICIILLKKEVKISAITSTFPFLFPPSSWHIDIIHPNTRKSWITVCVLQLLHYQTLLLQCKRAIDWTEKVTNMLMKPFLSLTETVTWWAMAFLCKILFAFGECHIVSVKSQQVSHDISPTGKAGVWVFVLFCYFKSAARTTVKVLKTPQPSDYSIRTVFKTDVQKYEVPFIFHK